MLRFVDRIAEALAVLTFTVSLASIFLNALNRYLVLGLLRDWAKENESFRPTYFVIRDALGSIVVTADEVPGLWLVRVAFLGAYIARRKEGHIAFDMFVDALSQKRRRFDEELNTVIIAGFRVLLFWPSIRMIRVSGATEIETAEIFLGWFMLILPIAAILQCTAALSWFLKQPEGRWWPGLLFLFCSL
ncbi:TRAP transporter small permease [Phaeobacter sp. C3_T13_0]|uniref:TRAP transporter small permease n=1 Tax=Phaeobacter cretensis TaxID=3342641 RepID=UPI0039BC86E4